MLLRKQSCCSITPNNSPQEQTEQVPETCCDQLTLLKHGHAANALTRDGSNGSDNEELTNDRNNIERIF